MSASKRFAMSGEWKVRPAAAVASGEVQRWEIERPDGSIIECASGSIAIELRKKLAHEANGILKFMQVTAVFGTLKIFA
jgi:hypothetical protein